MYKINHFFGLLFSLSLALSVWAVEREAPPGFTAMWVDGAAPAADLYVKAGLDKYKKFEAGGGARGPFYLVEAKGKPVVIYNKVVIPPETPGGAAKETYVSVAEIPWPAEQTACALLLLVATKPPTDPLKVLGVAMDDDVARFTPHSLRIYNLLNVDVGAKLPSGVTLIPARTLATLPFPVKPLTDGTGIANFPVFLASTDGLNVHSRYRAYDGSRMLYLLYPKNSESGFSVMERMVVDFPKPASAAPKS